MSKYPRGPVFFEISFSHVVNADPIMFILLVKCSNFFIVELKLVRLLSELSVTYAVYR